MDSRVEKDFSDVEELWAAASVHMPFKGHAPLPFIIPDRIPIDLEEAKALFEAFDENLNGDLDRDEVRTVLLAVGMTAERIEPGLDAMFLDVDEMNWDLFRLWMKRVGFVDREVCWTERVYLTLEDPTDSVLSKFWAIFMVLCIVLSVIMYMMESHPSLKFQPCEGCEPELKAKRSFAIVELVVIIAFSIDYCVRLVTVHAARTFNLNGFDVLDHFLSFEVLYDTKQYAMRTISAHRALNAGGTEKTIKWILRPMNIIDVFSIMPYFLSSLIAKSGLPNAMMVLRILRLCRLFRLFKLKKYSSGFEVFFKTVAQSMEAITVLLFVLALLLVFLGSLMYLAEGGTWHKPDDNCDGTKCADAGWTEGAYLRWNYLQTELEESPFRSIFDACWFVMTTITTVGYGDLSPTSSIGQAIAMVCMVLGILALAMPITVLGNNFDSQFEGNRRNELLQKMDVFTNLRMGVEKHMKSLDEDSVAYTTATQELEKMDTAQAMLEMEYQVTKKDQTIEELETSVQELEKNVEGVSSRMHGMEAALDGMLAKLVAIGGEECAGIARQHGMNATADGVESGDGTVIGPLQDNAVDGNKIMV
jgi:hypothetical protein